MSPHGSARPYHVLERDVVHLIVRQDPQFAVVTPENKEKTRRPVDPPPIVQLKVSHHRDPTKEFLVNPFLFMTATLVEEHQQEHGRHNLVPGVQIIGQNVSSLHRLKDISNEDGGFFVFGDISCRNLGTYRLQFNLFDVDKTNNQVAFVTSTVSEPFVVVSHKDFKGLSESTHLSRTFSDQGVRLRLRKEPRTIAGSKRSYDNSPPNITPHITPNMHPGVYREFSERSYAYETPMQKRARSGSDHTNYGSASSQYSGAGVPQYSLSNTSAGWPVHPPQALPSDQSSYGSLAPQLQSQTTPYASHQRYVQQDQFSADPASSNGNMYYSNTRPTQPLPRYQTIPSYSQQSTQSFESRTSRDAFQDLPAVPATGPMPEAGLVQQQYHDFQTSTPHTSSQPASISAGVLPNQQMQQEQDMQRTVGRYEVQSVLPIHSSNQTYQMHPSMAHSETQSTVYGHNTHPDMKYRHSNYHPAHNMYSADPPAGTLADSPVPLDTGMLTRSFAPAQQSLQQQLYGSTNGQGIDGYKQEPAPYPTPNQTSPIG